MTSENHTKDTSHGVKAMECEHLYTLHTMQKHRTQLYQYFDNLAKNVIIYLGASYGRRCHRHKRALQLPCVLGKEHVLNLKEFVDIFLKISNHMHRYFGADNHSAFSELFLSDGPNERQSLNCLRHFLNFLLFTSSQRFRSFSSVSYHFT